MRRSLEFESMARQRASFDRDPGLQARMLFTMFLLGLLYVAFVVVLLAAGAGVVVMVVVIGALTLGQLFLSDKIGLAAMGAKEVSPDEAPGLHAMIERLCVQADLPKPRVAVADSDVPNAFAMGRSQKKATVCCTTGIMRTLSPTELEGVLGHELTHVKNRDVLVMTIASFFASVARPSSRAPRRSPPNGRWASSTSSGAGASSRARPRTGCSPSPRRRSPS